jgi:hypothetical protein
VFADVRPSLSPAFGANTANTSNTRKVGPGTRSERSPNRPVCAPVLNCSRSRMAVGERLVEVLRERGGALPTRIRRLAEHLGTSAHWPQCWLVKEYGYGDRQARGPRSADRLARRSRVRLENLLQRLSEATAFGCCIAPVCPLPVEQRACRGQSSALLVVTHMRTRRCGAS